MYWSIKNTTGSVSLALLLLKLAMQTHENSALAEFAVKTAKYAEFTFKSGMCIAQR